MEKQSNTALAELAKRLEAQAKKKFNEAWEKDPYQFVSKFPVSMLLAMDSNINLDHELGRFIGFMADHIWDSLKGKLIEAEVAAFMEQVEDSKILPQTA